VVLGRLVRRRGDLLAQADLVGGGPGGLEPGTFGVNHPRGLIMHGLARRRSSGLLVYSLIALAAISGSLSPTTQILAGDTEISKFLEKDGFIAVELARLKSGYLVLPVQVAGAKLLLILDPGAPLTYFDPRRTKALELNWRDVFDEAAAKVGGATQTCYVEAMTIGKVKTGAFIVGSYDTTAVNTVMSRNGEPPIDGILGADVLEAHSAVIDYKSRRLFLRPVKR